jgi:3-hydroxyacyl-CoA dehydrogenase
VSSERPIGVVGAGNMGSGIAQKIATEGFHVVLADVDQAAAERGVQRIRTLLAGGRRAQDLHRRAKSQPFSAASVPLAI